MLTRALRFLAATLVALSLTASASAVGTNDSHLTTAFSTKLGCC